MRSGCCDWRQSRATICSIKPGMLAPKPSSRERLRSGQWASSLVAPGLRPLVFLRQAYPANHAPGVEVARELALVFVARHQHDDAPIVDVLQVHGGRSAQIAREGFRGLEHHLLPDPRLRDLAFRPTRPLPV